MVDLEGIKTIIRGLKPQLIKKYPIFAIGLFGSVVRDDFHAGSDIDIIVDFNAPIGIEFISLAEEFESALNCRVDLVSKAGIKDKYFKEIEPEIIYV